MLAVAAVVPALLGIAITGRSRPDLIAVALIAGAVAVGAQGTTATKRDQDDPALRRLLGVDAGQALVARAVLPSLLSGCWLALSLTVLCAAGALSGWLWPLLGLSRAPAWRRASCDWPAPRASTRRTGGRTRRWATPRPG